MKRFFLHLILIVPIFAQAQDGEESTRAIGMTISFPWVNNYHYHDYHAQQSSSVTGFTGVGGGLFYKNGKHKYSLNAGTTGDWPVPIAFNTVIDAGSTIHSNFVEGLYHRNVFLKMNLVAGVNFVRYKYTYFHYKDTVPPIVRFDRTIGITAGGEFAFSNLFSMSLLYRPAIVCLDKKQFRHLISLDARFNINFSRRNMY